MTTQDDLIRALDGSLGSESTEAEHASFLRARDGIRDVFARLHAAEEALEAADLTDMRCAWPIARPECDCVPCRYRLARAKHRAAKGDAT